MAIGPGTLVVELHIYSKIEVVIVLSLPLCRGSCCCCVFAQFSVEIGRQLQSELKIVILILVPPRRE
jgi:hypothetical protein